MKITIQENVTLLHHSVTREETIFYYKCFFFCISQDWWIAAIFIGIIKYINICLALSIQVIPLISTGLLMCLELSIHLGALMDQCQIAQHLARSNPKSVPRLSNNRIQGCASELCVHFIKTVIMNQSFFMSPKSWESLFLKMWLTELYSFLDLISLIFLSSTAIIWDIPSISTFPFPNTFTLANFPSSPINPRDQEWSSATSGVY